MTFTLVHFGRRFEKLGRPLISSAHLAVEIASLVWQALSAFQYESWNARRTMRNVIGAQTYFTGWQAMPLITLLAVVTGSVIILNTGDSANPLASGVMTGELLYMIVVKELGPLIVGLVVIARSGTAVASELGNMKANREWDALEVLGINPLTYIVLPRLVAGILSIVALTFYFDLIAILGGYLMTALLHTLPFVWFLESVIQNVTLHGLLLIGAKNVAIAVIIFAVSCYYGLQVQHSHHEVPQVTTKAVVVSIVAVTIINFMITAISISLVGWKS